MNDDRGLDTSETVIANTEADVGMEEILLAQADTGSDPDETPPVDGPPDTGASGISVLVPDAQNQVVLSAATSIENIQLDGDDLLLLQPDGSQVRIIGGALNIPTFIIGDIELPQEVLVAALNSNGFNVAAGPGNTLSVSQPPPTGSGGEFGGSSGATIAGEGTQSLGLLSDTTGAPGPQSSDAQVDDTGNIASVATGGVTEGGIVETVDNPAGDADPVAATGSITFFDPDFGETRDAEVTSRTLVSEAMNNGSTLTAVQLDALLAGFSLDSVGGITVESTSPDGGSIDWTYFVGNEAVDFLAAGEVITLSFEVQINDGIFSTTQDVTVTITGTNDVPVVAATDVTGGMLELVTPAGDLSDSGTIAFTDVDLSDIHTLEPVVASVGALGSLVASVSTDTTGTGLGGVISWDYTIAAADVEYLAEGQTKVESFLVTLNDGNGGTVERTVTITITGTNDQPVIDSITTTGSLTEVAGIGSGTTEASATGTITISDLDDTDEVTLSEVSNNDMAWSGGAITDDQLDATQIQALVDGFVLDDLGA
ncbi:MAG: VCBS domain-containing protein, partial [Hoeflea sp.]|uniref:VCBS domain-containing protein n=1 Tax=Hoeflea sp. TaxID=1940281 RepID=UPI003EF62FC0